MANQSESPFKGKKLFLLIASIIEFALFVSVWVNLTMRFMSFTITFAGIGLSLGSVVFQYVFLSLIFKKANKAKPHKELTEDYN